jgi:hypothetical protein
MGCNPSSSTPKYIYCHALGDRRRGIGLSTGFIGLHCTITVTAYHNVHPLQYFSRTRHKAGNGSSACSTTTFFWHPLPSITSSPKTPTQSSGNSPDTNHNLDTNYDSAATQSSEVYDLWVDCREDSAFGFGCLAITEETGTLRPRACTSQYEQNNTGMGAEQTWKHVT